jgi:hypothetical protein|tara:strand:- start:33 stop:404 length:372 start_codon:yes stop_codon:yes gene_type:complete
MLGWHISVYRKADDSDPSGDISYGTRVAVWQTGFRGLQWIDRLVKSGKGIDLGGDGYPLRYSIQAGHIIPQILDGPPEANEEWKCDPWDIVNEKWEGRTVINYQEANACQIGEWLFVEAWDES